MTLSTYSFEQEKCRPMFPWTRNTEAEAHAAPHARETVNLKRFIHMTQPHPSRPKALRLRKSTTGTILSTMQRFGRRLRAPSPAVREWESARREPESTARNAKPDGTRGTTRNAKPDGPPTRNIGNARHNASLRNRQLRRGCQTETLSANILTIEFPDLPLFYPRVGSETLAGSVNRTSDLAVRSIERPGGPPRNS